MQRKYIDGKLLKLILISGYNNLLKNRKQKTAENIISTLRPIIDPLKNENSNNIPVIVELIKKNCFVSVKGNSGRIVSHFLFNFITSFKEDRNIDIKDFLKAYINGANSAYQSIEKPKEETMLTVIRKTADRFRECIEATDDILKIFSIIYRSAKKTVEEFKKRDKGADNFLCLLDGMYYALRYGKKVAL